MGTCRLCLSPADMDIFFEDRRVNLRKFLIFTNLKIYKNDGLPQHICLICLQKLESIITFVNQCEESDKTLRSNIKPMNTIYDEFIDELKSFNVDEERSSDGETRSSFSSDSMDDSFDTSFHDDTLKKLKKSSFKDSFSTGTSDYLCNSCGQQFIDVKYKEFSQHLKIHKEKFPCDECSKIFSTQKQYNKHKSQHKSGEFCCKFCGKISTTVAGARYHELYVHKGDKKFICPICQKELRHPGSLKQHLESHDSTKPKRTYTCNLCEKVFLSKEGMMVHLRSHTGERPFPCSYCDSHFSSKASMREHVRLHTGETPFKCPKCFKGFAQRGNMKSHFKFNHRDYNYKESMMQYKKAEELKKALAAKEPEFNA